MHGYEQSIFRLTLPPMSTVIYFQLPCAPQGTREKSRHRGARQLAGASPLRKKKPPRKQPESNRQAGKVTAYSFPAANAPSTETQINFA